MNIPQDIKQQILDIIFKHVDKSSCNIFLFGSYARGESRQSSDIDLGIICDEELSLSKLLSIKEDLNKNIDLLRKIDIIDFNSDLEENFKRIALKDIKIWHQTKELEQILDNI